MLYSDMNHTAGLAAARSQQVISVDMRGAPLIHIFLYCHGTINKIRKPEPEPATETGGAGGLRWG